MKRQYMRALNVVADSATIKQPQGEVLQYISSQSIKESLIRANIALICHLQRKILSDTIGPRMKE